MPAGSRAATIGWLFVNGGGGVHALKLTYPSKGKSNFVILTCLNCVKLCMRVGEKMQFVAEYIRK